MAGMRRKGKDGGAEQLVEFFVFALLLFPVGADEV
jgi:hypothetical protein